VWLLILGFNGGRATFERRHETVGLKSRQDGASGCEGVSSEGDHSSWHLRREKKSPLRRRKCYGRDLLEVVRERARACVGGRITLSPSSPLAGDIINQPR
jgi:hypothetical protein